MFFSWPRRTTPFAAPKSKRERRPRRPFGFCFPLCTEQLEDRIAPAASLGLPTSGFPAASLAELGQIIPPAGQGYGQLPLSFEPNQGQADAPVQYLAQGNGYGLFLTPGAAVLSVSPLAPKATGPPAAASSNASATVTMTLVGADPAATAAGVDQQAGKVNYFIGNDPSQWYTDVLTFAGVAYQQVYPGIDMVYYGNQQQLEYAFRVAAGADPSAICLSLSGMQSMALDAAGNLVLHTSGGDVQEQAPVLYQTIDGARQPVAGHYVLEGPGQVGFAVGAYEPHAPLVIDPVLSYSKILSGSGGSFGQGITADASGNAYVVGKAFSTDFPLKNPYQGSFTGQDAIFVSKLNPSGTGLIYSTFLTGAKAGLGETATSIAVDASGDAYVAGSTDSATFPVTPGSMDTVFTGSEDGFVTELNPAGNGLVFSTFLGGSNIGCNGMALHDGNVYVTGNAPCKDFPTTPGVLQPTTSYLNSDFLAELNTAGTAYVYATYITSIYDTNVSSAVAVDAQGDAYITGNTVAFQDATPGAYQHPGSSADAYIVKVNPTGTQVLYGSKFGGGGYDTGNAIAVDAAGDAYVTGSTASMDFPTTAGVIQPQYLEKGGYSTEVFVTEFNPSGSALIYSTFLGGTGTPGYIEGEVGYGIALDSDGNAYIAGKDNSADFPKVNPIETTFNGRSEPFVSVLNPGAKKLLFSSYFGGSNKGNGNAIALDPSNNIYVTGNTGYPTNAFVSKISAANPQAVWSGAVSTRWDDPGNWAGGVVPLPTFNTIIPGALVAPNQPVLDMATTVNNLTIDGSATLFLNGNSLTISDKLVNQGTLELEGKETVSLASGNDTAEGTWLFVGDGSGGTIVLPDFGASDYYNLTIDDTHPGPVTDMFQVGMPLTVSGILTIAAGALDASNVSITAAGVSLNSGTLDAPSSAQQFKVTGNWSDTGGTFNANGGTVALTGGNQSIMGNTTFAALTKVTVSAVTLTFAAGSTQTITGPLTLEGVHGSLLALRSSTPGTPWSINPSGSRTIEFVDVQDSTNTSAIPLTALASQDSGGNGGWVFNPPDAWMGALSSNWSTPGNWSSGYVPGLVDEVVIPGTTSNQPILDTSTKVNNLTLHNGAVLSLAGNNLTVGGTFVNQGTLTLEGSEVVSLAAGNDTAEGTWIYVGTGLGGSLPLQDFGSTDYYNLTIDDTHATANSFRLAVPLTVAGTLSVVAGTLTGGTGSIMAGNVALTGGTLSAPSAAGQFSVSGNWSHTGGIFNADAGTVTLNGTTQSVTGNTTFASLSKTATSSATVTFAAGSTQTMTGSLTLTGAPANLLALRSSSPGSAWIINPSGSRTVKNVDVGDSTNINSAVITDVAGTDSGHNVNWSFTPPVTINTVSLPDGPVASPYRQTIVATGGTGLVTFSETGTLPVGLTLNSSGVLSGTPTLAGTYPFTVTAADTVGASASQSYTVAIHPPVLISTLTVPAGTAGAPYNQTIRATGGTGTYTFAQTGPSSSGSLPPGVTLSSSGVLAGTPTTAGTYTFTVKATDTEGTSASLTYSVAISPAVAITTATLLDVTVNQPGYNQTILASGGTGALDFTETGPLPPGLTLSTGGVLSGTPTTTGSYTFTVTATDTVGAFASQTFTLIVTPISLSPMSLANWTVNQPGYSQTIGASGGVAPYTFSATGTAPPGLILSSGGVLAGMPADTGTFTFLVMVVDSAGSSDDEIYTVVINQPVALITATLASWTVNRGGYNQTISSSGGTGTKTFSATGTLPPELTLTSGGVLSGTPTMTGTYTFTVTASDSVGASTSQDYTVVISPPLSIVTSSLPDDTVGVPYSQSLATKGGTSPYTFALSPFNLIVNGDFEAGNSGFTTQYMLYPGTGILNEDSYAVVANPFQVHNEATSYGDHTSGHGLMLVLNGATTPNQMVWSESVPVSANALYAFSLWDSNWSGYSPATLDIQFNGVSVGTTTAPAMAGIWQPFRTTWSSGAATSVTIVIYDTNTAASGNDFALDDIALAGVLPPGLTLSSAGVLSGIPTTVGTYNFSVTATDAAGASASQPYTIGINPPVSIATFSLANGTAGSAYTQPIGASGGTGTLTFSAPSSSLPAGLTLNSAGVLSGTPTTAGTYSFNVTVTDSVGARANQSYTIAIGAGAFSQYRLSVVGSGTVQAGIGFLVGVQAADAYGNPITSYSGPATVTPGISPSSAGSRLPGAVAIGSNGLGLFLASSQQVGIYAITVTSGAFTGSTTTPETVTAGPPVKLAFAAQPTTTPTGVALPAVTVQLQDPYGNPVTSDNTDAVTVAVASGPGGFTGGSTTTAVFHNGLATFSNLIFNVVGTYTLSEVVPAKYTGFNSVAFTVSPLQVVPSSFVGAPSGFSLQFNAPFLVNSTTPVLFGRGFGATAPVPSVTLAQTMDGSGHAVNIPIAGSLVLNTATNSITFVATDTTLQVNNASPVLPDGTYTVTVHSSASTDGFQAQGSGGGFLDGLGSGTAGSGDYTATFTVNAAAAHDDLLWVPATADGPGQALSAPGQNRVGGGYPIYLYDTTGAVTNVQATFNYNPALLTVTGVNGANFSLLGSSTPGHAVLQYSGPVLPAGNQMPIGFVTATVTSGTAGNPTPYKAKDLLHLSGVSLNSGAIPVATNDALHLVAYVGDGDGNGSYGSNDAVAITRVSLQTDTGFSAYPLVDPVIVADTDGSGFISADAPFQVNEAGIGIPTANLSNPPIPTGVVFVPIANNVDPSVSLPSDLHVGADGLLAVPVNIDDAHPEGSTGLTEGHLALMYDPHLFTVSAADVHLGSVLAAASGWALVPIINPVTGQIAITMCSTTPITSTLGGSLVTIDFHTINDGEPSGVSRRVPRQAPIELVASVNPSGQQVVLTELEDAQGSFTLTPAPTNGIDPRIDGIAFLNATPTVASASNGVQVVTTPQQGVDAPRSPGDSVVATVAPSLALPAPESPDPEVVAAQSAPTDTAVFHVSAISAHSAAAVAAATSALALTGTLAAAPLGCLGFQVATTVVINAQSTGGAALWQHLADPWLPELLRAPAPRVGSGGETLERALTGEFLLSQPAFDNLGMLNGEDTGGELDRPRVVEWHALSGTNRAALDQVFAQAADDTDTIALDD